MTGAATPAGILRPGPPRMPMRLMSSAFADLSGLPGECAFAVIHSAVRTRFSDNRNPDLAWTAGPAGTRSYVVACIDIDVPAQRELVNQEWITIPTEVSRVEFVHWLLVDIPVSVTRIGRGEHSDGITARGKSGPGAPLGARHGLNGYTAYFSADRLLAGEYYGYDGPCPPWNDEVPHRYVFTVTALDLPRLPVHGKFTLDEVRRASAGHILDSARLTARFSLNPRVAY